MTSQVKFTRATLADLDKAANWYDEQRPMLGVEFLLAVREAAGRIADHPKAFQVAVADIRKANLKRFPYALWFVLEPDASIVVAALHFRQDQKQVRSRPRKPTSG